MLKVFKKHRPTLVGEILRKEEGYIIDINLV